MNPEIADLASRKRSIEAEIDLEIAIHGAKLRYAADRGKLVFSREAQRLQRQFKIPVWRYLIGVRPLTLLTAPVIYALIVPLVVLDLFVTVYQAVCFSAYGIAKVRRREYLIFDRHNLRYLNIIEKVNCAFCSYANGLIAYAREIAARTEQYWCPIKHARHVAAAHARYRDFADFGDAAAYHARLAALRKLLKSETPA
jgi:hypothetical protein